MKLLIDNIRHLVDRFGKDIVLDKRFLNMLKDIYNFRDNSNLLDILQHLYANNAIGKIYNCNKKSIKKAIASLEKSIAKRNATFNINDIDMVLYSFAIAIGIISYKEYINIKNPTPKAKRRFPLIGYIRVKYQSSDKIILRNSIYFTLFTFAGLFILYLGIMLGWWLFPCILMMFVTDVCYETSKTNHLDQAATYNEKRRASFCACATISMLKYIVPASFIHDGFQAYSGALLLFIFVAYRLPFMLGYSIMEGKYVSIKRYRWWKGCGKKTWIKSYFLTLFFIGGLLCAFIFIPSITIATSKIENSLISYHRKHVNMDLGYKTFRLGMPITSLEKYDSLYHKKSQAQEQLQIVSIKNNIDTLGITASLMTFEDYIYGHYTQGKILLFKNRIIKIDLIFYDDYWDDKDKLSKEEILYLCKEYGLSPDQIRTDKEVFLDLYMDKYCTPEKFKLPILQNVTLNSTDHDETADFFKKKNLKDNYERNPLTAILWSWKKYYNKYCWTFEDKQITFSDIDDYHAISYQNETYNTIVYNFNEAVRKKKEILKIKEPQIRN